MLNPELDAAALAAEFAKDGRVRIRRLLEPGIAERVGEYCRTQLPFNFIFNLGGRNYVWSTADVAQKSKEELQKIQRDIWSEAQRGNGFQYGGYVMRMADRNTSDEALSYLHSLFDFLNSARMLEFIMQVTGSDDLVSADAPYTRYIPGQYLTRHRDIVDAQGRKFAYVLGFSRNWHPDWGGLLQFYEEDGTPRDAWVPEFNCLNLFATRHIHAVTYVTPFAGEPRLSLTGWFRSVPLDADT